MNRLQLVVPCLTIFLWLVFPVGGCAQEKKPEPAAQEQKPDETPPPEDKQAAPQRHKPTAAELGAKVVSAAGRRSCPVTTPNGLQLPAEMNQGSRSPYLHGNGKLWTILPINGILVLTPEKDGAIGDKFPWWRTVRGSLTIQGRRLDGAEGTLRSNIPAGYGATGFQSTAIFFSGEGCWEITGRVGDATLTFVLNVQVKR
jgi:hypothetical protein